MNIDNLVDSMKDLMQQINTEKVSIFIIILFVYLFMNSFVFIYLPSFYKLLLVSTV